MVTKRYSESDFAMPVWDRLMDGVWFEDRKPIYVSARAVVLDADDLAVDVGLRVVKIRLAGVDGAESSAANPLLRELSRRQRGILAALVEGKRVAIYADEFQPGFDRFGRVRGYVRLVDGGLDVNGWLIWAGLFRAWRAGHCARRLSFFQYERLARGRHAGYWRDGTFGVDPIGPRNEFSDMEILPEFGGVGAIRPGAPPGAGDPIPATNDASDMEILPDFGGVAAIRPGASSAGEV